MQKTCDRHGQRPVDIDALGDIPNAQIVGSENLTGVGVREPEQQPYEGRLACAIRANERYDFAGVQVDIDGIENLASAVATIHDDEVVQLEYLGRGLELRNHATPLNFRAVTSQHTLGAGMTARVVLQLKEQREGIVLPTSAVVRGSTGLPIVWIKTAPERFEPQAVKTAEFDGNSVVITAGLNPDQRVVTDGVTLLNQIR